jgi:hypothetical protein
MEILTEGRDITSIKLTPGEGARIRELLCSNTQYSFTTYLKKVGLISTNVYPFLTGDKPVTIATLRKLFSGTNIDITCQVLLTLDDQNGELVSNAVSMTLEEMLSSKEPFVISPEPVQD